ncbi:MAG: hypothetical protein M1469_06140 [Bacteroidetes bacterium]|nr:hypothetical protein [Bacteroidota bacterium]
MKRLVSTRNPVDGLGEWLKDVRQIHPVLGWTLTVISIPLTIALSLFLLFAAIVLGPPLYLIAFIAAIVIVLIVVGLSLFHKDDDEIDHVLGGTSGVVILILALVISLLVIYILILRKG